MLRLTTPPGHEAPARGAPEVWAVPFSFATTGGISVDFCSSGYLDVSFPPLTARLSRTKLPSVKEDGFPHSGIHGYA